MFGKVLILLAITSYSRAKLRQVTVVFRHGERTPTSTYDRDIYKNEDFFPFGWGQLTNEGKLQQYNQGVWLRERYRDFLGETLTPILIESSATTAVRAQMSMSLMLAGLMPPTGPQIWNKKLLWQPFPWTASDEGVDKLLLSTNCPRISEAREEVSRTEEEVKYNKDNADLYKYVTEQTGQNITNSDDLFDVYGTLVAEKDYGLQLPEWTKSVFPQRMANISAHHFIAYTQTKELKRLTGGRLLKKILESVKTKIDSAKEDPKIIAYAGHDSTVVNLLRALGVWEEQVPGYNIMAIIELHSVDQKNKNWTMKVMLRNSTSEEPYTLTIPKCSVDCPLEEVLKLTADIIPQDLKTECKTVTDNFTPRREYGP